MIKEKPKKSIKIDNSLKQLTFLISTKILSTRFMNLKMVNTKRHKINSKTNKTKMGMEVQTCV